MVAVNQLHRRTLLTVADPQTAVILAVVVLALAAAGNSANHLTLLSTSTKTPS
jgi:hypothetical protein